MENQWLEELKPALASLEQDRLAFKDKQKQWLLFSMLPSLAVAAFLTIALFPIGLFIGVVLCLIVNGVAYHWIVSDHKTKYVVSYKKKVVGKLLQHIGHDLSYDPSGGINRQTFRGSGLFSTRPDRYHTEDLIEGKHGKTQLRFAEVVAKERRRQNKKTKYVTFFRGLLLIADFHKHFQSETYVYPDTAENLLGSFGRTLQRMGGNRGTQLLQLEDVAFEREFAVYSTDQVEARYILSPSMMSRMVDMRKRLRKDLRIGFKDSCVILAIPHSSAYLEPHTDRPATNIQQVEAMHDDIVWFLQIVDELNLNTRIWTKE